jgi:hypothetical protein
MQPSYIHKHIIMFICCKKKKTNFIEIVKVWKFKRGINFFSPKYFFHHLQMKKSNKFYNHLHVQPMSFFQIYEASRFVIIHERS